MFAVASGQGHNPTDEMLQASFAGAAPRRSVGAAIRHGMAIGVAATVLQLLLLLALLYACGVIAS
jgi:ABC-type multidrug transport system permease subunit